MTPSQKLRSIADSTGLDGIADAIREIANEIEHNNAPAVPQQLIDALDRHNKVSDPAALKPKEWSQYQSDAHMIQSFCNADGLRTMLAATPAPEPAVPQGEPTEEMLVAGLKECEPLGELIDWREGFGRSEMRAVWAAMLAATPAPEPAVPQGWKLVPVEPTRAMWAAVNKLDDEMAAGSYDGKGCSIEQAWNCMLDFAPDAPALAATPAPAPAQEVGLTEAERVMCLIASGCIGTVKMTYDSGPYEITRTSINASRLIDAIIAALRAKGGK